MSLCSALTTWRVGRSLQTPVIPVSPVLLHSRHLARVRHHTAVSTSDAAVHRHGDGRQSHGCDWHYCQPAAGETIPEGLCHLPAGQGKGNVCLCVLCSRGNSETCSCLSPAVERSLFILSRPCISSSAWERWSVPWWLTPSWQRATVSWALTGQWTRPRRLTSSTSAAAWLVKERHCTTSPSILCTLRALSSPGCPTLSGSWLLSMWVHVRTTGHTEMCVLLFFIY